MSYLNTRKALITKITSATIANITNSDIAFENDDFDPKGKQVWLAVYFSPVDSQPQGKQSDDSELNTGFFQVSVFITVNNNDFDIMQLETVDSVLSAFKNSDVAVYQDRVVNILNSTVNQGRVADKWFQRDITINYLTEEKRL